jgi:hypothetical protein
MPPDETPDFFNASIDLRKLSDYCLNPLHPIGKHKARVFSLENISVQSAQISGSKPLAS